MERPTTQFDYLILLCGFLTLSLLQSFLIASEQKVGEDVLRHKELEQQLKLAVIEAITKKTVLAASTYHAAP